ncbi:MAG: hypothetical protein JST54_24595 [Deltaproteobacteria bacterium]|nr:hypothetical protein [Deltaproteobacteria bacterium]
MKSSYRVAILAALCFACSSNKSGSSGSSTGATGATGSTTSTTTSSGTGGSSGTDTTGSTGANASSGSSGTSASTGTGASTGSSGSTGNDAGFVIAQHPPMPQVQNPNHGPVLTSPTITAVTFDGDPLRAQLEAFVENIGGSSYWAAALPEYGVGPASAGAPVELAVGTGPGDGGSTFDDTDIQKWLVSNLSADDGGWGGPPSDSIYSFFFPAGTTITYQSNTLCAQGSLGGAIGGYHGYVVLDGGTHVAYAVVPRCAGTGASALDDTTSTASHEFGEAASDPYQDDAGYLTVAPEDFAWSVAGGEIGDLCELRPDAQYFDTEIGAEVQRLWSNSSAAASHDPCLPILPDAGPFFCSAPVLSTINIPFSGLPPFKALKMSVGQTTTVELDSWSDAPMPAWNAIPYDVATAFGEDAGFSFNPAILSGANGDHLNVDVTLLRTPDLGPFTGAFAVISAPQGATSTAQSKCLWPVLVYAGP